MVAMAESNAPFRRHPSRFFEDLDAAANAVVAHLRSTEGQFDRLTQQADPQRITADDIVACSMTGYSVPAPAAAWLLGPEGQWLTTEILADIPSDTVLWECEATQILRAAELFQLMRAPSSQLPELPDVAAIGQATATRLLAAKRPLLAPIDDRQIRQTLRYPKDGLWFRRWREVMDDELLSMARTARSLAAEDEASAANLSELRVLDIVIRRRGKNAKG